MSDAMSGGIPIPAPTPAELEAARQQANECYARYRQRIEHQDELLHQRAGWIVGTQSFLLGTYVLLSNNPMLYLVRQRGAVELPISLPMSVLDSSRVFLPARALGDTLQDGSAILIKGALPLSAASGLAFDANAFALSVEYLKLSFQISGFLMALLPLVSVIAAGRAIGLLSLEYEHRVSQIYLRRPVKENNHQDITEALDELSQQWAIPRIVTPTRFRSLALFAPIMKGVLFMMVWLFLWLLTRVGVGLQMAIVLLVALMIIVGIIYRGLDFGHRHR